jgi:hypothetical protein
MRRGDILVVTFVAFARCAQWQREAQSFLLDGGGGVAEAKVLRVLYGMRRPYVDFFSEDNRSDHVYESESSTKSSLALHQHSPQLVTEAIAGAVGGCFTAVCCGAVSSRDSLYMK